MLIYWWIIYQIQPSMQKRSEKMVQKNSYKKKKVPFPPWFSKKPNGLEKRYIRLGTTMIHSDAWRDLPGSACKLLVAMMLEAGGKKHFQFPCNIAVKYGFSKSGFWRYRDQLVANGFIEMVANNKLQRRNNVYGFFCNWKDFRIKK